MLTSLHKAIIKNFCFYYQPVEFEETEGTGEQRLGVGDSFVPSSLGSIFKFPAFPNNYCCIYYFSFLTILYGARRRLPVY